MSGIHNLNIRKLNFKSIQFNSKVLIISRIGGHNTIRNLIQQVFPTNITHSVTPLVFGKSYNGTYDYIIPPCMIYDEFNANAMDKFIDRQIKIVKKNGPNHPKNQAVVIFDNCHFNSVFWHNESINRLMKNGRSYNIFVIFRITYPLSIPPVARTCLDYILLESNFRSEKDKRNIYQQHFAMIPTFDMFDQIYNSVIINPHPCNEHETTNSHKVREEARIVLKKLVPREIKDLIVDQYCFKERYQNTTGLLADNRTTSKNIQDSVMWYDKCPPQCRVNKLGDPKLWNAASNNN